MKHKDEPVSVYIVNDLCEKVNRECEATALQHYLEQDAHACISIAGLFAPSTEKQTAALRKGHIQPHLNICCCMDTFRKIMTTQPSFPILSCHPGGDTVEEIRESGNAVVYAQEVDGLSTDELRDYLVEVKCCDLVNGRSICKEDIELQKRYIEAIRGYLRTAAAVAKGLRSDSAALFMDALCLLTPRELDGETFISFLEDNSEKALLKNAEEVYDLAEKAQRCLWRDAQLKTLRPITIRHISAKN